MHMFAAVKISYKPCPMYRNKIYITSLLLLMVSVMISSCKIYSLKDTSIPPEVKTIRVANLGNKTPFNPLLSPQLGESLRRKIMNQTRLSMTNSDDAHYDISGDITAYTVSTSGISNQQASSNRLNVTFHLVFKNRLDPTKDAESDVTSSVDFSASQSLSAVESSLTTDLVKNLTDAIFNKIFSNW